MLALAALVVAAKLRLIPTAGISALDRAVEAWVVGMRAPGATDFFLLITQFGGTSVVLAVALIALCLFLWRMRTYALPFFIAVLGNSLTVAVVKESLQRARPPADFAYYLETFFSFPSGHSAVAVTVYGFIAYALARMVRGKAAKALILGAAALFILLIGASRLYLGVHYLSDVLGGFAFGALWLSIGVLAHRYKVR